jgi:hypothetical protein
VRSKDGTTGRWRKIHTGELKDLLLGNRIGVNELDATFSKNWDIRKTIKILVGKTTFASTA